MDRCAHNDWWQLNLFGEFMFLEHIKHAAHLLLLYFIRILTLNNRSFVCYELWPLDTLHAKYYIRTYYSIIFDGINPFLFLFLPIQPSKNNLFTLHVDNAGKWKNNVSIHILIYKVSWALSNINDYYIIRCTVKIENIIFFS